MNQERRRSSQFSVRHNRSRRLHEVLVSLLRFAAVGKWNEITFDLGGHSSLLPHR